MAIDSAAKRKSVLAISGYFLGPVIVPDGSMSLFDRQVIGYGYGGIAIGIRLIASKNEVMTIAQTKSTVMTVAKTKAAGMTIAQTKNVGMSDQ